MTSDIELCLSASARLHEVGDHDVSVRVADQALAFEVSSPGALAALRCLAAGGVTAGEIETVARRTDGIAGLAEWYYHLETLEKACAVSYVVRDRSGLLMRAVPMCPAYWDSWRPVPPSTPVVLSRFVCLRHDARQWILESPLSFFRLQLLAPAAFVAVERLARPTLPPALAIASGISRRTARTMLGVLNAAGLVTPVVGHGLTREDADPSLAGWEFADLLFHGRSRLGRHDQPIGATFSFRDTHRPLPALKPPKRRTRILLDRPSLRALARRDPALGVVLEARRSERTFGDRPLTVKQLAEFLFRSARVRRLYRPTRATLHETSSRPYPSGGACYPLEIYLAVGRCDGLAAGLYHYDPGQHALSLLQGIRAGATKLLEDARLSERENGVPQVLVVLAARFGRVSWKYRSIAYATVLKDVGVLLQTMYLVATAMGLSACAVGCGDATLLARVVGEAFHVESSVGEFLLGSSSSRSRSRRASFAHSSN